MATPYYNVGKATLTAGSTTMTGQGTLWLGNVRSGDQVVSYTGQTAIVDTVNSNTSITLARAYRGTSQTAADYEIIYTPDDPFTQQLGRKVLEAINASALVKLGAVTPAARQLVRFDQAGNAALSPLSDYMLTLLDDADAGAARATLGISGAGSSVALRGAIVPPEPWPNEDLSPGGVHILIGGAGYYQLNRTNAGAPIQTPPGWPQTYGSCWGFSSPDSNYGYGWQEFSGFSGNRRWMRKAVNATTWGPWAEVYHQGNVIGAVSQVGGVPGGALSTGWQSNANGLYKRDFDGTQICIKLHDFSVGVNSAVGGEFASIEINSGSWAAAFVAKPAVSVWAEAADGVGNFGVRSGVAASATLCPRYRITSPITVASKAFSNTIMAIGRWF